MFSPVADVEGYPSICHKQWNPKKRPPEASEKSSGNYANWSLMSLVFKVVISLDLFVINKFRHLHELPNNT